MNNVIKLNDNDFNSKLTKELQNVIYYIVF